MKDDSLESLKALLFQLNMASRKEVLAPYLMGLRDKEPQNRVMAAHALGQLSDTLTLDALITALDDKEPAVQNAIYHALCIFDHHATSSLLFNRLPKLTSATKKTVIKILEERKWNPSNTGRYAAWLISTNQWEKVIPLGEEAIEAIVEVLSDSDQENRKKAISALGKLHYLSSLEVLLNLLKDRSAEIRNRAFEALKQFKHPSMETVLLERVKYSNGFAMKMIFQLLNLLGWKPKNSKQLIRSLIAREKWDEIEALGTDAIEPLIHAAKGVDLDVRIAALNALSKIPDSRVIDFLLIALRSNQASVVDAANKGLEIFLAPEWVDHLLYHLKTGELMMVVKVVELLGVIGEARSLKPLLRMKNWYSNNNSDSDVELSNVKTLLDDSITKIEKNAETGNQFTICSKCFYRFQLHKFKTGLFSSYKYYSCPSCNSNVFKENGPKYICITLDKTSEENFVRQGENLMVNWYKRKLLHDYDRILIRNGDDFEMEEMVMKLANDTDTERRKKMKSIPLFLDPKIKISPAKRNMLRDNFELKSEGFPDSV